jgi:hypothetical protein
MAESRHGRSDGKSQANGFSRRRNVRRTKVQHVGQSQTWWSRVKSLFPTLRHCTTLEESKATYRDSSSTIFSHKRSPPRAETSVLNVKS